MVEGGVDAMLLARVTGHLVATVKHPSLTGEKLMIVQPLDLQGRPDGAELVAVDRTGAGVGDVVLVLQEGGSCRQIMGKDDAPVEAIIAGVVDRITLA